MKKFILPISVFLLTLIFFILFNPSKNVYAAPKEITCMEIEGIVDGESDTCQYPVYEIDTGSIWCGDSYEYLAKVRQYEPSYKFPPGDVCLPYLSQLTPPSPGQSNEDKKENQPQSDQTGQRAKPAEQKPGSDEKRQSFIPIFIGEWFQGASMGIGLQIIEFSDKLQNSIFHQSILLSLTEEELDDYLDSTIFRPQIKNAVRKAKGEDYWPFLKNVEIDEEGKPVLIKTPQGAMQVSPNGGQKGVLEYRGNTTVLKSGQVEVLEETKGKSPTTIETPIAELFVIGTNFLVSYDKKDNKTVVSTYEGQVEVKTKDGKTTTVIPNGDKPGVILVTQKISIVKLVLAGLVLIAAIAGTVFILTKRGNNLIKIKGRK
ncbi:hypothetical protein A2973_05255 [Candidatus Gottesmanbacteria bacterium RIFCSPLOWO2_01_FULL_49_10]|uniref:FecR protein domain-containing protein n=1 Tax=Candidatus Gottesmanbacteria bacterium RIFCSPLOWO2_01_FULL_49_10 TaxID=1798396 RepID=A0A1F6AZB5_9BACT|nr:MAG: hypothetical protein A2973_05255 [Candidatus Gottesmanbacteria bacterium RIFCSPLOWO2_01_FULL_49_10]